MSSPKQADRKQANPPRLRAAGGAVWRRHPSGGLEVVLVHRPHYDDWSWPKGKVDPGETDEQAARREVREEASVDVRLGPELASVHYDDRLGRPKVVRYWAMSVIGGEVRGDNEIDVAEWLPAAVARDRLSYLRDQAVLEAVVDLDGRGTLE